MDSFDINKHINNLNDDGYTIIRNGFSHSLANNIIQNFVDWSSNKDNNFQNNMHNRVTNFHIFSDNTLELVTNKYVDAVIASFLGSEQVVYSSLFFKEGTEQHLHRDTPHFYTNPINKYCGVWYALEDIDRESGPLRYYKKSHTIDDIDNHAIYNELFDETKTYQENNLETLLKYNKIIEEKCIEHNLELVDENNYEQINKGDIIIWHPKLLHGGSKVLNNKLTRYSIVTHNVPLYTQVFNASHFFIDKPTITYINNINNYNYLHFNNVKYVDHNIVPKVQKSYL